MDDMNNTRIPDIPQGAPATLESTPTDVNPLLARVHMPGSTFKLPSGGIFYKNGELADTVEKGEVHVQPMTAYDEVILKTPDLLFSGEAVKRIFTRCIPEILKPTELFGKDVDFLMICLRKMTYGDSFQLAYTHSCDDAKNHEYSVNIDHFINTTKQINPTTIGKVYTTTIDNGQVVEMHPPKFNDVIKMMQNYDPKVILTPEKETENIIETVISVISSVDGVTNKAFIKEWLAELSAGTIGKLSNAIENTTDWGPDFMFKTNCKDCGKEMEITAPINPLAFFI